jgi:site-specific DNA recombinase
MKTDRSVRVAFYARVAVPHQSGPDRLAAQIAALRHRIADEGGHVDSERAFVDDGGSGASLRRPALARLRQQAAQGAFDCLYVAAPDRLTRRADHYRLLLDELGQAGVEVIFLEAPSLV